MLAKRYSDGKIINVVESIGGAYVDETGETYYVGQIELLGDMPSENRMRYEIAKAAMQGMMSNSRIFINGDATVKENCYLAMQYADEMIKQLKKARQRNENEN